jgi:hypothetical protein
MRLHNFGNARPLCSHCVCKRPSMLYQTVMLALQLSQVISQPLNLALT